MGSGAFPWMKRPGREADQSPLWQDIFYSMGSGAFPGMKRPGREADQSRAEVKNECSYACSPRICCGQRRPQLLSFPSDLTLTLE